MKRTLINLITLLMATAALTNVAQGYDEVYWRPGTVNLNITQANSSRLQTTVPFDRVLVTHNIVDCSYTTDPVVAVEPGVCYSLSCPEGGGRGKSPAWDAFYSASSSEKAPRLAGAIKGIGKKSAESLVSAGYFNRKPRSWSQFSDEINRAADNGVIEKSVRTLVLSTYREENMETLGYDRGACTETAYNCDNVRVISPAQYVQQTCDQKAEHIVDTRVMNFAFNVQNSVLLPGESDQVTIGVTQDPSVQVVQNAAHNRYDVSIQSVSGNYVEATVVGLERRQVNLPSENLQSISLTPKTADTAVLQIGVSQMALPLSAGESLTVKYVVRSCAVGWLGTCGLSWDKVKAYIGTINGPVSSFLAPASIGRGQKGIRMEVEVSIYKQNSVYFNSSPITKTTAKITL